MSSQKTLIALIAGATVGAVAGILLAPASGKDSRKKLMKKADGLREQLTDLMEYGASAMKDVKAAGKKAGSQATKAVHHTMDGASNPQENAKSAGHKA